MSSHPDDAMPLLELDPVHFTPQGLVPLRGEELLDGGASTEDALAEALTRATQRPPDNPEGLQVVEVSAIDNGRLAFSARGQPAEEPLLQIPLLMAHLSCSLPVEEGAPAYLALAPQDMPGRLEVWVMRTAGSEDELQAAVRLLSKSGVLRYDLSAAYVIGPLLARGGFASVYRAQQHETSSSGQGKIAVKVLPMTDAGPMRRQVRKEVELQLACQQDQPNICKLISVFEADDKQFAEDRKPCLAIAMSLASEGDLFDWVLRGRDVTEAFAANTMKGLLSALEHIHNQDIFHRDVKPENVLLTLDMRPLLSDFGAATRLGDVRRRPIQCGSAGYTAPEILLNMEPTTQSDIFSAGGVLYFMMLKQRPFCDPDLSTAVNSVLTPKINLDKHAELKESPHVKEFMGALLERSPLHRPDAHAALGYDFLRQMPPAPHPPPADPSARAHHRKQAFAKMLSTGEKQAAAPQPPESKELEEAYDVSLLSFDGPMPEVASAGTGWKSCFANSHMRCEPLVFRRRYVFSGGQTKSFLQIKPLRELLDVLEVSHTIWQTLEFPGCEQVPIEVPDDAEPYFPSAPETGREAPTQAVGLEAVRSGGPERTVTGQVKSLNRQGSGGRKFRINNVGGGMSPDMGEPARGQMSWWAHSQQPQTLGSQAAADKVNRDQFGTCHFTQERTEDGRRRRLVKKATVGDGQEVQKEEDFDDTASWQSWRSGVVSSASRRSSRGRSGSVVSMVSNSSAVAMRELLACSDDEAQDEDYAIGPPATRTLSGRSGAGLNLHAHGPRLSIPAVGEPHRRPLLAPSPPPPQSAREPRDAEQRDRDWGTCIFGKEQAPAGQPGQRGRRLVKPMIQQLSPPGPEEEEVGRSNSWMSYAGEIGRSLSQASMASEASMGGVVQPTPSAVGMQELLGDSSFQSVSPDKPRRGSRHGTNHMLQDLYAAAEYA